MKKAISVCLRFLIAFLCAAPSAVAAGTAGTADIFRIYTARKTRTKKRPPTVFELSLEENHIETRELRHEMMFACCNDGTRPVIFKIERIDIPENEEENEWLENQNFRNTAEDAYTG